MAKPKTVKSGEHIFAASQLTPLAIKWKELTARGQHHEAMVILEEIIKGATAMFERLALYEGFTRTVDTTSLVAAAQSRVVRWLLSWQPKLGPLFTYFSRSISGESRVLLADGTTRRIDEIVNNRQEVSVVTWDEKSSKFTTRPVIDWIKSPAIRDHWRKVSVVHPSGYHRVLYATFDHEFDTQRGWLKVDDLAPGDKLRLRCAVPTEYGIQALLGMYLGDGCLRKNGVFVVGHGNAQRFYGKYISYGFGKRLYDTQTRTRGITRPSNKLAIPLREFWPEHTNLSPKKRITTWLLNRATAAAIAFWYMDDGGFDRSRNAIRLFTDNFSREECCMLQQWLSQRFGILTSFHKRKGKNYGYLYVLAESRNLFFSLVSPYVLPEFSFKMPSGWISEAQTHKFFKHEKIDCDFVARNTKGKCNVRRVDGILKSVDLNWRYDITVADTRNFIAEQIVVHNCAKNAFLSEVGTENRWRKKHHVTGENLEPFFGAEDHDVDKHDIAAEFRERIEDLRCRWGDPQELGALRFILECLIQDHDVSAQTVVNSVMCAWCITPELARFFYQWVCYELRSIFLDKIRIPFTEFDLQIALESYTFWKEFVDIIGLEKARELIVKLPGTRIRILTPAQIAKSVQDYRMTQELRRSSLDPDAFATIARKYKKTQKSAEQLFAEMSEAIRPERYGDFSIYGDHD